MLDSALTRLEINDLVRRLNDPDLAYLIKHALVQETARNSLLRQDRKRLHRVVGETLETLYPERRTDHAALLAQHFADAGDNAKTLEYLTIAGEAASRLAAYTEALEHYTRALALAQQMDVTVEQLQALFLKCGRLLEIQNQPKEALETYEQMSLVAAARQAPALELAGLVASATLRSIPSHMHDAERARALSDHALQLAEQLGDRAAQAKILWNLMLLYSRADVQYARAAEIGERALAIARDHNLHEQIAYLLNDLSPAHAFLGSYERAEQYNLESRAYWEEIGNIPMLTDNLGYAVMNHLSVARYQDAIQEAELALQLSRKIGNGWGEAFSQLWIGQAYWEFGEITTALQTMQDAIAIAPFTFPGPLLLTKSDLSRLYTEFGDTERGLALAIEAQEAATTLFPSMQMRAHAAYALALVRRGELNTAAQVLQNAIPNLSDLSLYDWELLRVKTEYLIATQQLVQAAQICDYAMTFLATRPLRMYDLSFRMHAARIAVAQRQFDSALEMLTSAHTSAREKNARWSLWQVLALMAQAHQQRGEMQHAEIQRAAARAVLESIAARTPESLRTSLWKQAQTNYEL